MVLIYQNAWLHIPEDCNFQYSLPEPQISLHIPVLIDQNLKLCYCCSGLTVFGVDDDNFFERERIH
jgi:hypothetical protein